MAQLKDYHPYEYKMVCSFCHPNHFDEIIEKGGFHEKNGSWKGGWTEEKAKKYNEFAKEFEKDRRKVCINIDGDGNIYCCKEHLLEMVSLFDTKDEKEYDIP